MPRLSLRRGFIYIIATATFFFAALHIQQRELWARTFAVEQQQQQIAADPSAVLLKNHHLHQSVEKGSAGGEGVKVTGEEERAKAASVAAERPWYMKGGSVKPVPAKRDANTGKLQSLLATDPNDGDRIPQQLMFSPPGDVRTDELSNEVDEADVPLKKILMYNGLGSWHGVKAGRGIFFKEHCPVNRCALTTNKRDAETADAILFKDHFASPDFRRHPDQVWILYLLECPLHTQYFKDKNVFNWTATYRRDSDLVAPYERWQYYDENVTSKKQPINYAANKTKQVAWFVSNCGARNNRLQYAHELQKHISVDIFGACGSRKCPRTSSKQCFDMLDRDYKFYLAFENSNCKDYITEKFFVNGLGQRVIPITMGARPEDYAKSAPTHSYIHVDDFESPKHLADYLHKLDKNDTLYNEYFQWKGTGELINTYFFCRLCSLLHSEFPTKTYADVNDWWRGPGVCISGSWRQHNKWHPDAVGH